jgi:hypothetical protein
MKKICLLVFLLLVFIQQIALSEPSASVALPDEVIDFIVTGDTKGIHAYISSFAENPEESSIETEHRGELIHEEFSFSNINIEGVQYQLVEWYTIPDVIASLYSLKFEFRCPFGEEIEDSKALIDTVNEYAQKYEVDETTYNRYNSSDDKDWRTKMIAFGSAYDGGVRIILKYHRGDVSKMRFPYIEVSMGSSIEH